MKVGVFGTKPYDHTFLDAANAGRHALRYLEPHLTHETVALAGDATAVCTFVNDTLDRPTLAALAAQGMKLVALRCAGFNQVDLAAARDLGIAVARVPGYSPHAIAEHALALILSLDRNIHRAWARVREGNFALDGLLGFNLHGRTVGIVGTGEIGLATAGIMRGFGCEVLAFDPAPNPALTQSGGTYVDLDALLARSDIITLHCPLTPVTRHLIDAAAIAQMKHGVMLINTSRGAVIDTRAVIAGLKSGCIGYLGLDVYEEEGDLFFENLSDQTIQDDVFARLLTFPNVLITGHQAFFTSDAMTAIAATTIANITSFEETGQPLHPVAVERVA
ncbi:D-lactate dehydrogenase [Novosphingobium hassiacum]|uniref:D-lactate dehydrogenase n=1 Tax=Novosphingobium hassiacum TaxID=173676 RepID=A0A7W5ZZC3_9SPHN|nr:2-hydroxyacid dehydrogenase [Novosphingobium hassiacum]MBB3861897.1 D-lactate dehydrogenase [Novosphingobium hassiacum]